MNLTKINRAWLHKDLKSPRQYLISSLGRILDSQSMVCTIKSHCRWPCWLEIFRYHLGKPIMLILSISFSSWKTRVWVFASAVHILVHRILCIANYRWWIWTWITSLRQVYTMWLILLEVNPTWKYFCKCNFFLVW